MQQDCRLAVNSGRPGPVFGSWALALAMFCNVSCADLQKEILQLEEGNDHCSIFMSLYDLSILFRNLHNMRQNEIINFETKVLLYGII